MWSEFYRNNSADNMKERQLMEDTSHNGFIFFCFPAFSCASGEYLEMKNQVCSKCVEGTYSLGSGIKFDEWDELPAGFSNVATFMDTVVGPSDSRPDGCNK